MSRSLNWTIVTSLVLVLSADAAGVAQGQAIGPGFELERAGRYADAASVYFTTVRGDPTNLPALLGLERTLFVLNRLPELLPLVQNARARLPESVALRSLELRVYAGLNQLDSLETIARRWAAAAPQSEQPYREWGQALADHRVWDEARRALLTGRRTLGGNGTPDALRRFADLAGALTTTEGHRVRGLALTRWADLVPWQQASRARAEAVRELLEAGDKVAARRVLEGLTTDSAAPAEAHAIAEAALLQVLVADGQLDVAEERLTGATAITADDLAALRLALSQARVARGELDRAETVLGEDSSVAVVAQRGWIALYRGNLKAAMDDFRLAGPYATDRAA